MFQGCESLVSAAPISATTLANGCFNSMFASCYNLKHIEVAFDNWNDGYGFNNWMQYVEGIDGEFICPSGLPLEYGYNRIPETFATPTTDYFYFEYADDWNPVYISLNANGSPTASPTNLQWSYDRINWEDYTVEDSISIDPYSNRYLFFRSKGPNTYFTNNNNFYKFNADGRVKLGGNIMSLVDTDLLETTLSTSLNRLFFENTNIVDASKLKMPATTLAVDSCYSNMFAGCTSLTKAPALPATTLRYNCYGGMFNNCTSLTDMPELPATQLENYCYNWMFNGCTALTGTVDLPATTAAQYCYQRMFQGCTILVDPPTMHLTTVAQGCCDVMFWNCSALTKAPDLPATTLAQGCYGGMFNSCSSLSSMSVGFTSWTAVNGTGNWVYGVNGNGTFHCPSGLAEEHGNNRIPTNFTVAAS